jgi:hypothetical protein
MVLIKLEKGFVISILGVMTVGVTILEDLSLMSSTILFSGPVLLVLAWPGGAGFFAASPVILKLVGLVGLIGPFGD